MRPHPPPFSRTRHQATSVAMRPDTRLLLINHYQGLADSLRAGTLTFTELQAQSLLQSLAPTTEARPQSEPQFFDISEYR